MTVDKNSCFLIPAGTYRIGMSENAISRIMDGLATIVPDNEKYLYNSFPDHEVDVGTCMISKKLVVYEEFRIFVEETGYETEAEKDGWGWVWTGKWEKKADVSWRYPFGTGDDLRYHENGSRVPVMQVSFNDALAYCRWKSECAGIPFRLPCEPEWEVMSQLYAEVLRKNNFPEGDDTDAEKTFISMIIDTVRKCEEVHATGLVWEWTMNWFKQYPGGRNNPEFGEVYKVLRGGSLLSVDFQKTGAYRFRRCPTARSPYYGFRTCMEING